MNSQHRCLAIAAWCVVSLLLASALFAQEVIAPQREGVAQDWSDHNIVFTLDGLAQHPELIYQEPRVLHQLMQRFRAPGWNFFPVGAVDREPGGATVAHRDWNVPLLKGHVSPEMYPAKYSFNPAANPDCTNDFVVFGLDIAGTTGGQANLVGFNKLYSGAGGLCGAAPAVYFAYNTTTQTGG